MRPGGADRGDGGPIRGLGRLIVPAAQVAVVAVLSCLAARQGVGNALAWARRAPDAPYVDFNVLLLAGRLAGAGRLGEAYSWAAMAGLERADSLRDALFMPFSYPPPFALAMAGLAGLPVPAAYAVFVAAGLVLFGAVLRRLAGPLVWPLAAALAPAACLNVAAGQNGLLFAGLAGLAAALEVRGRCARGGAVAGLLAACKPQVAVGPLLLFLLRRDRRALLAAGAGAAALFGVSAAVLGPAVVPAFLAGLSETSRALATGHYPLHRMASVFACLLALGVPAPVALATHAAVACAAFGGVAAASRRGADPRTAAGLALLATAFASPYLYDYDLAVPGLGFALLARALARPGEPLRLALPLVALACASTVGFLQGGEAHPLSLGAPLMLVGFCATLSTLAGARRAAAGLADATA